MQNFDMSDSKSSEKRKGMFLTYELYFKCIRIFAKLCVVIVFDRIAFFVYAFLWYFLMNVNKKLTS